MINVRSKLIIAFGVIVIISLETIPINSDIASEKLNVILNQIKV